MRRAKAGEWPSPAGAAPRVTLRNRLREVGAVGRFLRGLGPFLRQRPSPREAQDRLECHLADRSRAFSTLLDRAVWRQPRSLYRALLVWAGFTPDSLEALLRDVGVEGTLERLHDAGVFVTLEEFKGNRPLQRPGLELQPRPEDFDNPLSKRQYEARTGGSTGTPRRILVGLDLLEHEHLYHTLFYARSGFADRPIAMWYPAPPGAVGIKNALILGRLGHPVHRWFSQSRPDEAPARHYAFAKATALLAGLAGAPIPVPRFTPAREAGAVAAWLSDQRTRGTPGLLLTTPSAAARTCTAAGEQGLDLTGTAFILVGEPFTAAKAGMVADAGCSAVSHYAMVEAGLIGLGCLAPTVPDEVHLVADKMATIARDRVVGGSGTVVPALFHTTLVGACPKVMLNVESGDAGVLEERDCDCGVLPAGFRRHLHTIRSYEKLTSEGMHFLGSDLLHLIEEVLPARFGGCPTDYQLVEREEQGVTRVSLVVSPSLGTIDPGIMVRATLDALRRRGVGAQVMAEVWAGADTLRVVRADPHVTPAGKIQPLQRLAS